MKIRIFVALIAVMFTAQVSAVDGSPEILGIDHSPDRAGPGTVLNVTANISSESPLETVEARLPGENIEMFPIREWDNFTTWKGSWTVEGTEDRYYMSGVKAINQEGEGTLGTFKWKDPSSSKFSCTYDDTNSITFSNFISSGCTLSSANLDADMAGDIWDYSEDTSFYIEGDLKNSDVASGDDRDEFQCDSSLSDWHYTGAYDGDVTGYASDDSITISTSGESSTNYVHLDATLSWSENCNSPPSISNPDPAESNDGTSPVDTTDPNLNIDVNDPDGDSVNVDFYNADGGSYSSGANLIQWDHAESDGATSQTELSYRMDEGYEVTGKYGETQIGNIDCGSGECNQFTNSETYSTCITGYIYAPESGTYSFATDSDDASDFFMDVPSTDFDQCDNLDSGNRVTDWYDSHGDCGECWSYNGDISLSQGYHSFVYRHSDRGGGDAFKLAWQKPSDGSYSVVPSNNYYHQEGSKKVIGEAGRQGSMNDYHWYGESLSESYGSTPYVFATTQTTYGGQDPSAAHIRGVTGSGFETQHCEFDASNTCDTHNAETNAWFAVDPSKISDIDGMDAGTVTTYDSGSYSVSFDSSISSTPLFFTNIQSEDGGGDPLNTQAYSVSSSGATVEFCEQDSTDGCDTHTSETVAWLAIDPSKIDRKSGFDYGTFSTGDNNWESISFSESFSSTPAVIADVQTENGGQEALYPEVDHVGTSGADIRFCESEGDDSCDTHATETVAWLALDTGAVEVDSSGGGLIGSDTVYGSGTASVTWSGLTNGETYNWWVEASDGSESVEGGPWEFTVNANAVPKVLDISFENDASDHAYDVRAEVMDGDLPDDTLSCSLRVDDGGSNYETYNMNVDTSHGNESEALCTTTETVNYADDTGWSHLQNTVAEVTVSDSENAQDSETADHQFPNHAPVVDTLEFNDYKREHSFNVSAVISDGDNDVSEFDECRITFDPDTGTADTYTVPIDTSYGGTDTGRCVYDKIQAGGKYEVLENVDVTVEPFDIHGDSSTTTETHQVPNTKPQVSIQNPSDGETVSGDTVDLVVYAESMDDYDLDLWFYGEGQKLVHREISGQGTSYYSWDFVVSGSTYDWHVDVSDGYENRTVSATFHKTTSGSYKTATGLEYKYTDIVVSEGRTGFLTYNVENKVSESKDLKSTLSGVNAEFEENEEDEITYTLGPGESRQFGIIVNPQNVGDRQLEVTTENLDLKVESTETFPVHVNEPVARKEEVPGIGLVQLGVLAAMASTVYFFL